MFFLSLSLCLFLFLLLLPIMRNDGAESASKAGDLLFLDRKDLD